MVYRKRSAALEHRRVELDGIRYVIVRESIFEHLCEQAGIAAPGPTDGTEPEESPGEEWNLDRTSLAEKLVRRRQAAGLSQAELARRAGVRPETLNRIERGRTTPDFATVRKLVLAMNAAERGRFVRPTSPSSQDSSQEDSADGR